ncbi:MAG: sugar transferase, partial [Planctomycetota bacterium]|nr:sugar transferase [Planctomycetota bacterium]
MKRLFDVVASTLLLALLAPVLVLIAVVVALRLGRPVLFTQERPGLHGRAFHLHKFRSMSDARDADGRLLPDAQRLDAFGRFLRSTSLDELPELWDVLLGRMSL